MSVALYACRLECRHGNGGSGNTAPIATIQMVGHRDASTLRPGRTLASYQKAIDDGADIIESDLVPTKNGVLVARHENEISGTINVADVAAFVGRKATKTIDGQSIMDWFIEGFTSGEPKALRVRERIPSIRPDDAAYNGQLDILTLDEIIALVRDQSTKLDCNVDIYPEARYPTHLQSIGLPLEDRLIDGLHRSVFTASRITVYIQSSEVANLKAIHNKIGGSQPNWKFVQLMGTSGRQPYDLVVARDNRIFGDMMTSQGMRNIAAYTNGVGPGKSSIVGPDADGKLTDPTDLIRNVHNAGLMIHLHTFRSENTFLPPSLRSDADNTHSVNDPITEIQASLCMDVDGFLTDDPVVRRQAVPILKR